MPASTICRFANPNCSFIGRWGGGRMGIPVSAIWV